MSMMKIHRRLQWEHKGKGWWSTTAGPFVLRLHTESRQLAILTYKPIGDDNASDLLVLSDLLAMAEDVARNAFIDGDEALRSATPGRTFID